MARIRTESLQAGMQVAVDVKNMDGMLLLPHGCELSERHINILQAWGVTEIEVGVDANDPNSRDPLGKLAPETLAALTAEIRALFSQPDESNPGYQAVFQAILVRRAIHGQTR